MVVGATGTEAIPPLGEGGGESLSVGDYLLAVGGELGLQGFTEGEGLGGDDVHERATLGAGENFAIDLLGDFFIVAEDEAAAGAAEGFVGGGGYNMGVGEGRGVNSGGDETGDVGDVGHEIGADGVGNLAEAFEIYDAGICGITADNEFGFALFGDFFYGIVVKGFGFRVEVVIDDVVEGSGEVGLEAVAEVTAGFDGEGEDGFAGLEESHEGSDIGVGSAVGLDIRVAAVEELFGPVAGEVFRLVVEDTATVVSLAGIALGIFVGETGTHGVHDGGADMVFTGDEFEGGGLALGLVGDDFSDSGIGLAEKIEKGAGEVVEGKGGGFGVHGGMISGRSCGC